MDALLADIAEFVEAHRATLELLRVDCSVDVFCGVFSGVDAQGGFQLDPVLMRRLADLDLRVTFDVYRPGYRLLVSR